MTRRGTGSRRWNVGTYRRWLTGASVLATAFAVAGGGDRHAAAASTTCTRVAGSTIALIRVDRDTTLPLAGATAGQMMSASSVAPGPRDSLLAGPDTPMPAARVTLLRLDSGSRALLAARGVTMPEPRAYLVAAPYRADCRTIRWTDTSAFMIPGEEGYVRAELAPTERWINGIPLLVIADAWYYPYPRRRGLAFRAPPNAPLTPPEVLFSFDSAFNMRRPFMLLSDTGTRRRAIEWARANPGRADLEPLSQLLRQAILDADWRAASEIPSPLRGTYRVRMATDGIRSTWYFRTHDRPGYPRRAPRRHQTIAEVLASPHVTGYQLVGYSTGTQDSLPALLSLDPRDARSRSLIWLGVSHSPTAPGEADRTGFPTELMVRLGSVPSELWDVLEPFTPPMSAADSTLYARTGRSLPRSERQPVLPITIRLVPSGARADTTLSIAGRGTLRVSLERIDTLSIRRPF